MIISHDRKTLFIGVPKNGSQTARAVLSQFGVDLVGEMGRHPTAPEAIKLAQSRFPSDVVNPTEIYAFWRDPVERFCSAVEFHKRCLPNSFIQLFPDRFTSTEPHLKWFETDPGAIALDLRSMIDSIGPAEILAALAPPTVPGVSIQPRGGNLSFYRPQSEWLGYSGISILPFADYETGLRKIVDLFGGCGSSVEIPKINKATGRMPVLNDNACERVRSYYHADKSQTFDSAELAVTCKFLYI